MLNDLESVIQSVIARATSAMATEIAQAVRQSIASEIMGGGGPAPGAPAKKKLGRPPKAGKQATTPTETPVAKRKPGRPRKAATAQAPEMAAKAKPPKKPAKAKTTKPKKVQGKKGRGARTYTDADLARALEVIKAKPGLLPSQYQAQSGIDEKVWANAIYKLKSDGKIKVVGKARNTSYVVV